MPAEPKTEAMSATASPRSFAAQHAFNREVWDRLVDDPKWIADVVWYPADHARAIEDNDVSLPDFPPDICVEVQSPGNTKPDIEKKAGPYFGVSVQEVWLCDRKGKNELLRPGRALTTFRALPRVP